MSTLVNETFASGIPGGFATTFTDPSNGTISITHNVDAVDIVRGVYNAAWIISGITPVASLSVELDVEYLANTSPTANFFGVYFTPSSAGTSGVQVAINAIQRTVSGVNTLSSAFANSAAVDATTSDAVRMGVNDRHKFRFETYVVGSERRVALYVDDVLTWYFTSTLTANMQPSVYVRDISIKLHSITILDTATNIESHAMVLKAGKIGFTSLLGKKAENTGLATKVGRYFGYHARNLSLPSESFGDGVINGDTFKVASPADLPYGAKVRLYSDATGAFLAETRSNSVDGAWSFGGLSRTYKYTIIAIDEIHNYRAVIADNLTPE